MKFKNRSFTLVELIIVIAIIAVLAAVSVLLISEWLGKSRDTRRIGDISQIQKGLDIAQIKNNEYPTPDSYVLGTALGTQVVYKGTFGDGTVSKTPLKSSPKDPSTDGFYVYSTTQDKSSYQISYVLEYGDKVSFSHPEGNEGSTIFSNGFFASAQNDMSDNVYAGTMLGGVQGNYKKVVYFSTGGLHYVANVPSLIFTSSTGADLLSTGTYFVLHKKENLPYSIAGANTQVKDPVTIIREVNNSTGAILTAVNITQTITSGVPLSSIISGSTLTSFGGTGVLNSAVTVVSSTTNTTVNYTPCSPTTYSGYSIGAIAHGATQTFTKSTGVTNGNIVYSLPATCNNGTLSYGLETNSLSCNSGFVASGSNSCVANICGGTIPANATSNATSQTISQNWTYSSTAGVCTFACNTNYFWSGSSCVANTQSVACGGSIPSNASASTATTYTQTWNGSSWTPTTNWSYSAGTCGYTCNSGYTWNGSACIPPKVDITTAGSDQSYNVPAGVTQVTIKAWGAGGGGGAGSAGGYAVGTYSVSAGQQIIVRVGTTGNCGANASGGRPNGGYAADASDGAKACGGGGRSEVFIAGSRKIIAGAGGGAGVGTIGGAGGGSNGETGQEGGSGGTQSAGGSGGANNSGNLKGGDGGGGGWGTAPAGGGDGRYGGGGSTTGWANHSGSGGGGSGYLSPDTSSGQLIGGSGTTPGNSGDSDRGTGGNSGSAGKVILIWN